MSTSELIRHRLPTKLQISINKTLFPSPFIFRFTFSILFFFFLLRFSIFEITFYFCLATDSPIFQKLDLIDMLFGCSGIRDQRQTLEGVSTVTKLQRFQRWKRLSSSLDDRNMKSMGSS
ncbi:hypothetical protein AAZV13_13G268650 [Glycine max]